MSERTNAGTSAARERQASRELADDRLARAILARLAGCRVVVESNGNWQAIGPNAPWSHDAARRSI